MKKVMAIVLIGMVSINVLAAPVVKKKKIELPDPRHNVYADIGLPPGLSLTYNYKLTKKIGLGIGAQGYRLDFLQTHEFIPAVYADLRMYIMPRKKHQLFCMVDLGLSLFKSGNKYYSDDGTVAYTLTQDNGFYYGMGFGYFRMKTKRGGGFYASMKIITNICNVNQTWLATNTQRNVDHFDSEGAISVGFKF